MSNEEEIQANLEKKEVRAIFIIMGLSLLIFVIFVVSLFYGVGNIPRQTVLDILFNNGGTRGQNYVVKEMRIPRAICAATVGAGLAISGMAMQALFRNPMASPSTLGISSGAAFGASIAIAFGIGTAIGGAPVMAFLFCLITMLAVYALSITRHGTPVTLLLLAGVALGSFFGGLTSFLHFIVDAEALQNVVYWTLGSFERCYWSAVRTGVPVIVFGVILLCFTIKELNIISLGEEQAESLGVNTRRVKLTILLATSLTVGGCVAISGVIGFVGLIIPHICRALTGPNHKILAPMCIVSGAIFMMLMDILSKSGLILNSVIPVGVLTSLLGAPFFIYIMRKKKTEFW